MTEGGFPGNRTSPEHAHCLICSGRMQLWGLWRNLGGPQRLEEVFHRHDISFFLPKLRLLLYTEHYIKKILRRLWNSLFSLPVQLQPIVSQVTMIFFQLLRSQISLCGYRKETAWIQTSISFLPVAWPQHNFRLPGTRLLQLWNGNNNSTFKKSGTHSLLKVFFLGICRFKGKLLEPDLCWRGTTSLS